VGDLKKIKAGKLVGKIQRFSPVFSQKSLVYFLDNRVEIKYKVII